MGACVLATAVLGCGGPSRHVGLTEQPDRYIRSVFPSESVPARTRNFGHPVVRSRADWAQLLGLLQVKSLTGFRLIGAEGDPEPAFRQDELVYLSEGIESLFSQIGPHEWVVFYLSAPHETGATELTTGALFLLDNHLHLLLTNYRHLVTIPEQAHAIKQAPLSAAGTIAYRIVPHKSWTVITENRWGFSKLSLARLVEIVMDAAVLQEEPGLEGKLKTLKRLREQDLISEKEYQRKRGDLLKAF